MHDTPPSVPDFTQWPSFPFEGDLHVKQLDDPVPVEPPRKGEGLRECTACNAPDEAYIWVGERWRVRAMDRPTGLPMVLILESRTHLDLGDLPNLLAAELGVMTVRLERAIRSLDGVARVHVNRWGDGSAHLHMWFLARPYGRLQLRGTFLSLWDSILPPISEAQWRENLALVAAWLAEFGGRPLAEPPRIQWQAPSSLLAQSAAADAAAAAAAEAASAAAASVIEAAEETLEPAPEPIVATGQTDEDAAPAADSLVVEAGSPVDVAEPTGGAARSASATHVATGASTASPSIASTSGTPTTAVVPATAAAGTAEPLPGGPEVLGGAAGLSGSAGDTDDEAVPGTAGQTVKQVAPDNGTPDDGTSDDGTPHSGTADNSTPDNSSPDNGTADNSSPDSSTAGPVPAAPPRTDGPDARTVR
ncbi:hypothetical protein AB0B57_07050 [Micromonospora sp. NPDC049101]|uniref:hypothetical protein n=1 Tax=Micromonospora sp. NPDC049101 TaxID=3155032 RepID=UPI00340F6DF1